MNLAECAASSRSFRKLIKELALRLPGSTPASTAEPNLGPIEHKRSRPVRRQGKKK
jgi:hypothetical protein